MRHLITEDGAGTKFQWVDTEKYMVMDTVTGEPRRLGLHSAVVRIDEAFELVKMCPGWETRLIIVRLDCIAAYLLGEKA